MSDRFLSDAYKGLFGGHWALYRWSLICLFCWLNGILCLYRDYETLAYQFLSVAVLVSAVAFDMWDAKLTGKSSGRLKRFIQRIF